MRPRTLALLFLLVAGLLAFIAVYEGELPSSDERVELAKRVLRIEPDEVRGLTLGRGESRVRFERQEPAAADGEADSGWQLRTPLEAPADGAAIDSLLDRISGLERVRTLEEIEPAELGLAEPRGRLIVESGDEQVELLIGSEVPASSTMILGVSGRDEAYVVADALWQDLAKPAGDWRSRDLGPASREAIQRIALGSSDEAISLARSGESFWVEEPYVDKADKGLVAELLGEILGLRVERFVDDQPAPEPSLAWSSLEVELDGRNEPLRIGVVTTAGEDEGLRLARIDGQLVEIRTELATLLGRAAEEWRSRAWASLEVFQIDRLEALDASGETLFERDGGDWLRDGERVEYEPVSELLYALTGVEAESSSDEAAVGEPVVTLEISGEAGELREILSLYAADADGVVPARVDGRQVTLLLAEGAVADLQLKLGEARSAAEPSPEDDELEPLSEDL